MSLRGNAVKIKNGIFDILFPPRLVCCSCRKEAIIGKDGFCESCRKGLEPFIDAPIIGSTDGYIAALYYNSYSEGAVWNLKYNGNKYVAEYLAALISIPPEWAIDCVVPIPLHKKRYRVRGFNQSELIARHICSSYDLCLRNDILVRTVNTFQQAMLSREERIKNVIGAFAVKGDCRGLNVLLVDDVCTTGGTITECAKALKATGCSSVYAATVCFARS